MRVLNKYNLTLKDEDALVVLVETLLSKRSKFFYNLYQTASNQLPGVYINNIMLTQKEFEQIFNNKYISPFGTGNTVATDIVLELISNVLETQENHYIKLYKYLKNSSYKGARSLNDYTVESMINHINTDVLNHNKNFYKWAKQYINEIAQYIFNDDGYTTLQEIHTLSGLYTYIEQHRSSINRRKLYALLVYMNHLKQVFKNGTDDKYANVSWKDDLYRLEGKQQLKNLKKNKAIVFFVLPAILLTLLFGYVPMTGIIFGFKKSIELSKKYDLYRQNYCGCKYSIWF